jgi:antitoxin HicB
MGSVMGGRGSALPSVLRLHPAVLTIGTVCGIIIAGKEPMTKLDKLRKRIEQEPKNVRFKDLEYYLHLPYRIEVYPDGDGYTAAIPDLPGCLTFGDSLQEVLDLIGDAKAGWLELAIENRQPIPEPILPVGNYSGKFTVRLPRSLHRRLAERARMEGISLNQLVNVTLAEAVCKA